MSRLRERARIGVSAVVMREHDGAFLLVKRARPPAKNMWAFAGGKVEFGETLTAAVSRELLEEAGVHIDGAAFSFLRPAEIIVRDGNRPVTHFVLMCFSAYVADVQPIAGDDASEARFFSLEAMRVLAITPSTLEIAEEISGQCRR